MTSLKKEFGKKLKEIRRKKGISQMQLAEHVGCDKNTISNIETGVHGPRFQLFEDIVAVLDAHPKDFFEFSWPPKHKR